MAEEKKRQFVSNVQVGTGGMDIAGLRQLGIDHPQQFAARMQDLIDKGLLRWEKVRDLKGLFAATGDIQVPVVVELMPGVKRSIYASAFPLLAGGMTVAAVNAAYERVPTIGQELVTEMEDNKRFTVIASVESLDVNKDGVREGEDYPEIGASEETYRISHKRNGRRIAITAEMIEENDVANIVALVNALGEIGADYVEELTLDRVTDRYGSASSPAAPYVLNLKGTDTQLYNATANNPGTRAPSGTRVATNSLVDGTDLENARVVLAAMLNSRGKRIAIPMSQCKLLVPDALASVAFKILNSEYEPGVENELNSWGPRGKYRPKVVSSPKVDDISTTGWYLGRFARQFVRKWKQRFEYITLTGDTQAFLMRRVAFQARMGWDCEVGARDYNQVVQSLEGSTP